MADFVMPSLGADMESGTLLEWRVKPGDSVSHGDIVAVVDTSKAEIEVEVFEDGVIEELLVPEGTRVPVGTPLARVRPIGSAAEEAAPAAQTPTPARMPSPDHHLRVSPLARRTAEELGVDLGTLHGSGPGGAITRDDVQRAVERVTPAATPVAGGEDGAVARQAAMRQAIGALMARSKREIPHYYLQRTLDVSAALAWLEGENLKRPLSERLLPSALLMSAVAKAAAQSDATNGFWMEGSFAAAERVHLGVAISLRGGGLVAPAIHDADRRSPGELMETLRDLVKRARAGRLRSSEMSDPTITVTNLGEQGAELVHGVIYPPQVALVGFGSIGERPWASGGMLGVRPLVTATLAGDHRASDGHAGSRFLALIDRLLQEPAEL